MVDVVRKLKGMEIQDGSDQKKRIPKNVHVNLNWEFGSISFSEGEAKLGWKQNHTIFERKNL